MGMKELNENAKETLCTSLLCRNCTNGGYWHFGYWHFVHIGVFASGISGGGILYTGILSVGLLPVALCILALQSMAFCLVAFHLWRFVRRSLDHIVHLACNVSTHTNLTWKKWVIHVDNAPMLPIILQNYPITTMRLMAFLPTTSGIPVIINVNITNGESSWGMDLSNQQITTTLTIAIMIIPSQCHQLLQKVEILEIP